MNQQQRGFIESVLADMRDGQQTCVLLEAPAGTGKMYCLNNLLDGVRGDGKIAEAVAMSGVVTILLSGGDSFHSQFKVPLNLNAITCSNVFSHGQLYVANSHMGVTMREPA